MLGLSIFETSDCLSKLCDIVRGRIVRRRCKDVVRSGFRLSRDYRMNYQKKIKTNSNTNVNGQECRFYTVRVA